MKPDTIVLGAGMVGVSIALHLQARGRAVALVDRRGAAEETSFGNAGIIQREASEPYMFPRGEWGKIVKHALNQLPESNLHYTALPRISLHLFRFWRNSTPEGIAHVARSLAPLVHRCIDEHEALAVPAGATAMLRRTGYIVLSRDRASLDEAVAKHARLKRDWDVDYEALDAEALRRLEPNLAGALAGGIHLPAPMSVSDPGGLGKAYAELFVKRGGAFRRGEARTLTRTGTGWQVMTAEGPLEAREAVVALGPWADTVLRPLGLKLPLFVKRGYHRHYKAQGNATLGRPVIDPDYGYAMAPLVRGIRITTGAEFALRDAPPTPVQLARVEPKAREIFPLGETVDAEPWLGRRPCTTDMLPVIGPAPRLANLWLAIGHQHWGFTLGPATGRLLAEMMSGTEPFADPRPFRADRF